jgi:AMMECR1 domain-containing protein
MPPLSSDDRRSLLALARRAVLELVLHHSFAEVPALAGRLAEPGSAFVTLHCFSKLRGCIGRTDGALSLGETVAQCAISAAAHDPRFAPIAQDDLPGLEIEISVLSEFQPLSPDTILCPGFPEASLEPASPQAISKSDSPQATVKSTSAEAILKPASPLSPQPIVPGIHGLLVVRGDLRGLLLPQVAAERRWSAERFLEETCEKAGLDRNAWRDPRTNVFVFSAEVFSEANAQSA